MTLNHLKHRIKHLDDKYPWSMHPNILLVMLLVSLVLRIVTVGYFLFRLYRMRSHLMSLKDLKNFFNGTADSAQLSELRVQLKTHLSSRHRDWYQNLDHPLPRIHLLHLRGLLLINQLHHL